MILPTTRRTLLTGAAASLAGLRAAPVRADNVLRWASLGGAPTFDPHSFSAITAIAQWFQVYEGLVDFGVSFSFVPQLAVAWRPDRSAHLGRSGFARACASTTARPQAGSPALLRRSTSRRSTRTSCAASRGRRASSCRPEWSATRRNSTGGCRTTRDAAMRLLAEAGYPDGFAITLDCPNNRYINDNAICRA